MAMCGGPQEYITYEFVPASPAVSCMSGSSKLNSFRDRRQVAVQLVLYIYIYIFFKKKTKLVTLGL